MKPLKLNEIEGVVYHATSEARQHIANFIEDAYNWQRLHSALNYLTLGSIRYAPAQRHRLDGWFIQYPGRWS
ncbi:hypothetical protein [Phyllobacterium myrsinacearum]|uniref:hypothetical protein n=1 Tax=Phyllobacterium myrsinacearum TaxID=28101 RepID=UPI003D7E7179